MIADLHCDLLVYLEGNAQHTPLDPAVRCSLPQLRAGGVTLQTLAIYSPTKEGSVLRGEGQLVQFKKLLQNYPKELSPLSSMDETPIKVLLAVENASNFAEETEALEGALQRLERWIDQAGPILYVSLTWNEENRFGGGNLSTAGLKRDGEILLEFLSERGIAVDFSHTSDALAHDILNYIDRKGLPLTILASHSNFRAVTDAPRNLPDELAKEILARGGVIGLNFVRKFVGSDPEKDFLRHVRHVRELGGIHQLCMGADFFYEGDTPSISDDFYPFFFPDYANASCYPRLLKLLRKELTEQEIEGIAHRNLLHFLGNHLPVKNAAYLSKTARLKSGSSKCGSPSLERG